MSVPIAEGGPAQAEERSVFSIVVPKSLAEGLTNLAKARGQKRATLTRTILMKGYERERRIEELDRED